MLLFLFKIFPISCLTMVFFLYQKLLKAQNKTKKSKTSIELINNQNDKKSKKRKELIDENEEISSDSDIEDDNQQTLNGNVRLDNLLLNNDNGGDDDDDEENMYEQRLKRAKEYIEQIAKQG